MLSMLISILISTCFFNAGTAQINPSIIVDNNFSGNLVWEKSYGGSGDDRAFYSLPLGDHFLVVGSTKSNSKLVEGWALMLDDQGNMLWNRTFLDGTGTELRYAVDLSDGFLLVGNQFLDSDVNGYIVKVDFAGNIVWKNLVGGLNVDKLFAGVESPIGYAVFGLTFPSGNDGKSASWAVQFGKDGEIVWQNTFGQDSNAAFRSVVFTDDGYVAAGYIDVKGQDSYDFYLAKIALDGSLIWDSCYDNLGSEKAYSMTYATEGYILTGESHTIKKDADAFVVRVDSDGTLLWSKAVGGSDADLASFVSSSPDQCFLVCGFSFSSGAGQRDFWLFKISDKGEVRFNCALGNAAFQEAYCIIDMGGDEYVLVGWTDPFNQPALIGKAIYDFWVTRIKLTSQSNLPIMNFVAGAGCFAASAVIVWKLKRKPALKRDLV